MTDDNKDVVCTYIGRTPEKNKLVYSFQREDGSLFFFPKGKAAWFHGAIIGRKYLFKEGKLPQLWLRAKVGEVSEEERNRLQAQDRAYEMQARERRGSASPELDEIVHKLSAARNRLPYGLRAGFDAWLLNQLQRPSKQWLDLE